VVESILILDPNPSILKESADAPSLSPGSPNPKKTPNPVTEEKRKNVQTEKPLNVQTGKNLPTGQSPKLVSSLPPLSEVLDYCSKRRLPESDAKYFHDHWLGNGFTNNGKQIRDWRAVIRSWQIQGYLPSQRQAYSAPKSQSCLHS
jgi:hypothetical protein